MDAQTTPRETTALAALLQSVARLELEEGYAAQPLIDAPEVLDENRFLAARDGMDAELIDLSPSAEFRHASFSAHCSTRRDRTPRCSGAAPSSST